MFGLLALWYHLLLLSPLVRADFPDYLDGPDHHPRNQSDERGISQDLYVTLPLSRCLFLNPNDTLSNLVRGLLRSEKITRLLPEIPCDIISTLDNDADQASKFVHQLEKGRVPTLIKDLPQEVVDTFTNVYSVFKTLPSQLLDAAQATVTEAAHLFDDIESGAIVSDLEEFGDVAFSDITSEWGDLTAGLKSDWDAAHHALTCLFGNCPVSTIVSGLCQSKTAATTTTSTTETGQTIYTSSLSPVTVVAATPSPANPVQTPTRLTSQATVKIPSYTLTTGNISLPASPTLSPTPSPASTGGSARILPSFHMLDDSIQGYQMVALALFMVAFWL